jgi:hypothetical protein
LRQGSSPRLRSRFAGWTTFTLTTTITAFTHAQRGSGATIAFVNAFLRTIIEFASFCVVLAIALDHVDLLSSLLLGLIAQLAVSGFTLGAFRPLRFSES